MSDPDLQERLSALPSVDELLRTEPLRSAAEHAGRETGLAAARRELERARSEALAGNGSIEIAALAATAAADVERASEASLRGVINATGIVVHTNLGRAPLANEALQAVELAGRGYTNLEYDLEEGARGSRHAHFERLLCELTGAEAALAVNNNAAAVLLALGALAAEREVVISRGQLVEIGGSFRIPDILRVSGARLVEVGTTNRTRLSDYERAIGDETGALMRVHASNFRTVGFTEEVAIEELCALGRRRGLAVIDDLGSGVISGPAPPAEKGLASAVERLERMLSEEPSAKRSIVAGADVICFSGDKLLGGPQAGIVVGRRGAVEQLRSHPLARAMRIDKLSLAALEATLRLHRNPARAVAEVPVLRMLSSSDEELSGRAERLLSAIAERAPAAEVTLERGSGRVGGGALPLLELEGPVVALRTRHLGADGLKAALRRTDPPVIARIHAGALRLDPRTISDAEVDTVASAVAAALG